MTDPAIVTADTLRNVGHLRRLQGWLADRGIVERTHLDLRRLIAAAEHVLAGKHNPARRFSKLIAGRKWAWLRGVDFNRADNRIDEHCRWPPNRSKPFQGCQRCEQRQGG